MSVKVNGKSKQVCRESLPVGVSDSYRNDPNIEALV